MRILILGAFQTELDGIIQKFQDLKQVTLARRRCVIATMNNIEITFSLSGLGTTSAACTTTALCETIDPDFIILCGVAGGLDSDQMVGDLIVAQRIVDADLHGSGKLLKGTPYEPCLTDPHTLERNTNEYEVHPLILEIASKVVMDRVRLGTIVTSNIFPAPKELFCEILKLKASAIEMESAGVFKAAEYYNTPVMTVRAISNLLNVSGDDLGTGLDSLAICSERIANYLINFLSNIHALIPVFHLKQEKEISELIIKYDLIQHPEGGWYRETFKSKDLVTPVGGILNRYHGENRTAGSSIIYLLAQDDFSAWHTVQSDETWSFHTGDPLLLRLIDPVSGALKEIQLGPEILQFTVKAGHVFSAESNGRFSIVGCAVTPGFDFKDFRLISNSEFIQKYPNLVSMTRLVRDKPVAAVKDNLRVSEFNSFLGLNILPLSDEKKEREEEAFRL